MSKSNAKGIKAVLGFRLTPDADILFRARAVLTGLTGNPAYPNPAVDLAAVFNPAIDAFAVKITESLDGGKKAITEKDKERETVIEMLTELGHYVEAKSNGKPATFTSSGFEAKSKNRVAPQPLTQPVISNIDHGNTGEITVRITAVPNVRVYELRKAAIDNVGAPGPWTSVMLTNSKTLVNGLTPGTTYAFQVRALGTLGYTDWSDSATLMCI